MKTSLGRPSKEPARIALVVLARAAAAIALASVVIGHGQVPVVAAQPPMTLTLQTT